MHVGTGKAGESEALLEAFARGRTDLQFFSHEFLGQKLHDGQLRYVENANATVNCLSTANRYGKTTILKHIHCHGGIYKVGGEPRYLKDDVFDLTAFLKLRYRTIHTAFGWETAALVWDDIHKTLKESEMLGVFVENAPKSLPPHIDFITGSRWQFRTLGHDASGIDGNSYYVISLDEAGWVPGLEEMMQNVIRVRVADVRGRIHLCGTFKPGISKDFYKFCVRASAATGLGIAFDHRDDVDDAGESAGLEASIRKYLREYGIDLDEFADALTREAV